MLITIAPQNALQKLSTWNPTTTLGTTSSNSPFRMRMKKPSVKRMSGALRIKKTPATRRTSTTRKASGAAAKKNPAARTVKVSMPAEAGTMTEPSDDAVRLRAYFISERRRRFALPGDAESDWVEARRQLLSEIGPR